MKVKVSEEFNVFELFVHDNEAIHAIDQDAVAEAINERISETGWTVYPPDGLDRFTLRSEDEDQAFTERCYTIDQVKAYLPVDAVEALEEIDLLEFDLSP